MLRNIENGREGRITPEKVNPYLDVIVFDKGDEVGRIFHFHSMRSGIEESS